MDKPCSDYRYSYNRNYGCRIHDIIYKGLKSLLVENEKIRCLILVDKGTDIIEILYKPKDIDFMWKSPLDFKQPSKIPITKENKSGSFLDLYFGGWHEMLPNVYLPANYKGTEYGLHGEVSMLPWNYEVVVDTPEEITIKFFIRMYRAPLYVEKYLNIKSNNNFLSFKEDIVNEANEDFEMMWGHHIVYGKPFLDEHCIISLPKNTTCETYEDYSGNSPFDEKVEFEWPMAPNKNGVEIDISRIMHPEVKKAFNVYIKEVNENWYGITNTKLGIGMGIKWDKDIYRSLMLWFSYQGFYDYPFYGRTYSVGIEPWSTVPGDLNEIVKNHNGILMKPGQKISTEYEAIIYESNKEIKGFNEDNTIM